jgi:hypothetical protein
VDGIKLKTAGTGRLAQPNPRPTPPGQSLPGAKKKKNLKQGPVEKKKKLRRKIKEEKEKKKKKK